MGKPRLCFPGFGSWLKALTLLLFLALFTAFGKLIFTVSSVVDFSLQVLWRWDKVYLSSIQMLLFLGCLTLAGMLIPVFVLGHVHQFFWADPDPKLPKWLPNRKSQIQGFYDWLVGVGALTVVGLLTLGSDLDSPPPTITTEDAQMFTVVFVIVAAYLDHLIKKAENLKRPKPKAK